jgi:hypothetical protein
MMFEDRHAGADDTSGSAASSGMAADSVGRACLALLQELEQSLQSSQAALLGLDGAATEQCTREQVRVCRGLQALLLSPSLPTQLLPTPVSPTVILRELSRRKFGQGEAELAGQVRAAGRRVQHLARVQAALLRRSQQSLSVLANWVAGAEAVYRPPDAAVPGPGAEVHEGF